MATGRERRADRLNERLRGAQRTNVGDDSFNLDLAGLGIRAEQAPASTRRTPNTSAKRRRLDDDADPAASQGRAATGRRTAGSAAKDPYDMPDTSKESIAQTAAAAKGPQQTHRSIPRSASVPRSSVPRRSAASPAGDAEDDQDALETLPAPSSARSPARPRSARTALDEIEESPAAAPGSGRRRGMQMSSAGGSSARLHDVLGTDNAGPPSSSPLARKKRRSDAAASVRTSRGSATRLSEVDEVDELSPDRPRGQNMPRDELSSEVSLPEQERREEEEAQEIDATEAAKTIGRKRSRRGRPTKSPELGSGPQEQEEEQEPSSKRRRGRPLKSPATQKQPAAKKTDKPAAPKRDPPAKAKEKKAAPKAKTAAGSKTRRQSGNAEDDAPIDVTVQRFVNYKRPEGQEADAEDPLHTELPFANRGAETVVDVFAQVCDEVIGHTLGQLQQRLNNTDDAPGKKECRVKMRAIEAYREELSSRMLQHAIHLSHWQSLRKRVRHVQKEKLALRDEILSLKAEREQVALRMDAVRIKHEADTKDATYRLDASALMHDIDLAVEQGQGAPELSRAVQKQADLANLELSVSRISEQASSASSTGGLLSQARDFNAFLERAAVALETR